VARSDPKPPPRIHDKDLLAQLHKELRNRPCEACGKRAGQNLHHIRNKPRDDVRSNLAWLCGTGSSGCHGAVHGSPYVDEDGERWDAARVRNALTRTAPKGRPL